jgi:hypothetical protein
MIPDYIHGHICDQNVNHGVKYDPILYVIGVCSNPARYRSRMRLAKTWIPAMAKTKNVKLMIVESSYGDRHHQLAEICKENGADYLPLQTDSEIWNKENMVNLGADKVFCKYPEAYYIAWVDMDVFFNDSNWAVETVQQLQHFAVVQPWTDCCDMGPTGNVLQLFKSFGYQHQQRVPKQMHPTQPYTYAHTGYAWACRKDFFMRVRGLLDWCILGSADHHMAFAMIGEGKNTVHGKMHPNFFRLVEEWGNRAMKVTKGEVGFCNGMIEHAYHGSKKKRYYRERWQILIAHNFDPLNDVYHNDKDMIQLDMKPALEHEIHMYNVSRDEDGVGDGR